MPPVANPLSFDEHRDLGREIVKTRARMSHLRSMVSDVYGLESVAATDFKKVVEALDELVEGMQAQAKQDCPDSDVASFYR